MSHLQNLRKNTQGEALSWFRNLGPNTIGGWDDLNVAFTNTL